MSVTTSYYNSPIGIIRITSIGEAIISLVFVEGESSEVHPFESYPDNVKGFIKQLEEYFAGSRKEFSVKLIPEGTDFQKEIWEELSSIPFGATATYSGIANKLKKPDAVRAVGNANGKNKILLLIPCHRIIGNDGNLVGYAGELWRKKWLLEHEAKFSKKGEQMKMGF
jgi:methylated-DNA-[protein]-cysteine S-methyltransferase